MLLRGDSETICGFCKGRPVGNAATWLDGKPRPPAPCPRCGNVAEGDPTREEGDVMPVSGRSYGEHLIRPDAEPRWTINGHTMKAEGPWLKNDARLEVVPAAKIERLREALNVIGTDCHNFVGPANCVNAGRTRGARYSADAWCEQCIAREALNAH